MSSVKYNGNIEATGFCIPNKTSSDILIADGTTLDTSELLSDYYTKDEADALHTSVIKIKGTLGGRDGSIPTLPNDAEVGDAYIVDSDAESSYAGHSVESGDIFVWVERKNMGYWTVIQSNWTASSGSSDLSWGSNTTLATVGGVTINAKLPTNPVDELEIGGRNLLRSSNFSDLVDGTTYNQSTYWLYYADSQYKDQYSLTVSDGYLKLTSTVESWSNATPRMGFCQTQYNISGQKYILSFDAYADTPVYIKAETGYGDWEDELRRQITTDKQRYSIEITGENGGSDNYNIFFLRLDENIKTSIYFNNFKLEQGNKATAWTPAPEDLIDYTDTSIKNIEIGGRNLAIYSTAECANCKKNSDYSFVQTTADTDTTFDLNILPYLNSTYNGSPLVRTDITKVGVYKFNTILTKDCNIITIGANGATIDTLSKFYLNETISSGTELVISLEITNITQGSFSWKNVMIEKGNKATDWTPAPEDIEATLATKQDKITGTSNNILYIGSDGVTSVPNLQYNASTETLRTPKINITRTDDWVDNELKPLTTQSVVVGGISKGINNLLFTRAAIQAGTGTDTPGTYNTNILYLNPEGGSIRIGSLIELTEDITDNTMTIRRQNDFSKGCGVFDINNNCFRRNGNSTGMTLGSSTYKWADVYTDKINGYTIASNVPSNAVFTDTNYYPTAFVWNVGTTSGPTGTLSGNGMSNVTIAAVPTANATQSGVVTIGAQSFAGIKTFNNKINIPAGTDTGIWSGSAFLLGVSSSDSSHAGCTSGNIVVGDPTKKLVLRGTDISFYDGDANKSRSFIFEDSTKWDNYLSLSGGTMTGAINFPIGITSLITLKGIDLFKLDATDSLKIQVGNSTLPVGVSQLISTDSVITPKIKSSAGAELTFGTNTITSSNSTITATAFFESSDIRKKDIKSDISLDKCYDLIDKCQTIIYSLKSESKEQIGLIAQEVEEFFPEVVATDEEGFKSLAYDRLVVICFKVLKDVIKRLERLENE